MLVFCKSFSATIRGTVRT